MSPDTMFMTIIKVNTSITITVLLSLTELNAHCSHQNMQNNNKIICHHRLQTVLKKKRLKTVWVDLNNMSKENSCEKFKNSF